jgi:hypothetical protein
MIGRRLQSASYLRRGQARARLRQLDLEEAWILRAFPDLRNRRVRGECQLRVARLRTYAAGLPRRWP